MYENLHVKNIMENTTFKEMTWLSGKSIVLCKIVPPCGGVGRKAEMSSAGRNRSGSRNESRLAEIDQKAEMGFGQMEVGRIEVQTNTHIYIYIVIYICEIS